MNIIMKNYIKILKAISNETRLKIIKILLKAESKLCVCEIVYSLNLPFYTISRHIKELKKVNILKESKEGKFINYSITISNDPFLAKLFELINSLPEKEFENEMNALKNRLALRKKRANV